MSLRTYGSTMDVKRTLVYNPEEAYLSRILAVNATDLHMAVGFVGHVKCTWVHVMTATS